MDNTRHGEGSIRFLDADVFRGQWTNDENLSLSFLLARKRAANSQDVDKSQAQAQAQAQTGSAKLPHVPEVNEGCNDQMSFEAPGRHKQE